MSTRPREWYDAGVKAGRQQILDEQAAERAAERAKALEAERKAYPSDLPSRESVYASWGMEVPA